MARLKSFIPPLSCPCLEGLWVNPGQVLTHIRRRLERRKNSLDCYRLYCLKLLLSVGFACGLIFEKRAWNLPRFCPRLPVWSKLKNPYETALYRALFPLLFMVALPLKPVWSIGVLVALAGFSCACDCTRFRPWLYQYSFIRCIDLCLF